MFRLAHLSDVHLGPLPRITYRELASKRVTGYINWRRNRAANLHDAILDHLTADMARHEPDHVVVTGDIMNLALDAEIELGRLWLESLGDAENVSIVPGNHDAYVPGSLDKACKAWAPWMKGDGEQETARRSEFPYLRRRGPVAIIGTSSAHATAPFIASGRFGRRQAARMAELLAQAGREKLFRVVLIHHPPIHGATATHHRLFGITRFQDVLRREGAELVLHGHTHLPSLAWIDAKGKKVPVAGVSAAGQAPGGHRPPGQYNLFHIGGGPGAWNLSLERRGVSGVASPVEELDRVTLSGSPLEPASAG